MKTVTTPARMNNILAQNPSFRKSSEDFLTRLGITLDPLPDCAPPPIRRRHDELARVLNRRDRDISVHIRRHLRSELGIRLRIGSQRNGGDGVSEKRLARQGRAVDAEISRRNHEKKCAINTWHIALLRTERRQTRPRLVDGLTYRAKRTIRRLACALEDEYGRDRVLFCTLTLPGSTTDAMNALAAAASTVVHRLLTFLRRYFNAVGGSVPAVGVWELQKRGALHLHFVCVGERGSDNSEFSSQLSSFWFRILSQISRDSGVDMFARSYGGSWRGKYEEISHRSCRVEIVRKSVASYMSSYLSKTLISTKELKRHKKPIKKEFRVLIKQYWFATDALRGLYRAKCMSSALIFEDPIELCLYIEFCRSVLADSAVRNSVHCSFFGDYVSTFSIWGDSEEIDIIQGALDVYVDASIEEKTKGIRYYRQILGSEEFYAIQDHVKSVLKISGSSYKEYTQLVLKE